MSLPSFSVKRPIASSMLLLAGLLLGVVAFQRLEVTLLPEVPAAHLLVWIGYPGADLLELEESVARPAEEAVVSARGVRDVRSTLVPGGLSLTVMLQPGSDPEIVALGVRERLDAVRWSFPDGVQRPVLLGSGAAETPDLVLALAAQDLEAASEWSDKVLRKRMEQIAGVARAQIVGAPQREVTVTPDATRLATTGIGIAEIARAINDANVLGSGGTLRRRGIRYALRIESELETADAVRAVVIPHEGDHPITVGDLATVTEGFAEADGWSRLDGRPAVGVLIYRESGANLLAVSDAVTELLDTLTEEFPEFQLQVIADPSPYVRASVGGLTQAVWLGGLLAFLVLVAFLREFRAPLVLVLALPLAGITSFAALDLFGITLNLMSLGGLALGVGMLVDNSVICLENIHRLRGEGHAPARAAAQGAEEVSLPMLASTLTTCAVFVPLALVPGPIGRLFRDQAVTVSVALGVSLLVALTLLPMLAGRIMPLGTRAGALPGYAFYHRLLMRVLARPRTTLLTVAVVLAVGGAFLSSLPREVLPALNTDLVQVALRLPPGSDVSATDTATQIVEDWVMQQPEVAHRFVSVGAVGAADPADPGQEPGRAWLQLRLTPEGTAHRAGLVDGLRDLARAHPEWTLEIVEDRPELAAIMPRGEAALSLEILGPNPLRTEAEARRIAAITSERLRAQGLEVRLRVSETEPRLAMTPREDVLHRQGLNERDLLQAIEARGTGVRATTLRRFDRDVPVMIRQNDVPPEAGMVVAGGRSLPVRDLFETHVQQAPARIVREQQRRMTAIRWDGDLRRVDVVKETFEAVLAEQPLPEGMTSRFGGSWAEMQRTMKAMTSAFALSAGLVLLILAAQFESLRLPLLIFVAVPLAIPGVALALLVTSGSLNAFSGIGLVVLVGIVVNDSILKVDLIRRLSDQGFTPREAVLTASRQRYRPILMTTLTTALALVPVWFSAGSEYIAPLAATVIGGLVAATALTLLVIPAAFVILQPAAPASTSDVEQREA